MKTLLNMLKWIVIIVVAIVIVVVINKYYKKHFDMSNYIFDNNISTHVELHKNWDNYDNAIFNTLTQKYTIRDIDWVSSQSSNSDIAVFCRHDKRGFFDINTGEVVIKPQYQRAWVFGENVAAVVKDNKFGFVNDKNETVIPFQYVYNDDTFKYFDCIFRNEYCLMLNDDGLYGFIDKSGKWVVKPQFEEVYTDYDDYYIIVLDGKYGLLDNSLNTLFATEYDYISVTDCQCFNLAQDGRMKCVDIEGNVIYPFVYDSFSYLYYYRSGLEESGENRVMSDDYVCYNINDKEGVLRRDNGRVVIPAKYNYVVMISDKLFKANVGCVNVLLDANGNVVNVE